MKITHYLIGVFTVLLFLGILLPIQAQEDASPTLKLGLYADTSNQRVVDLRTGGILRGFKGEPSNQERLNASNSQRLERKEKGGATESFDAYYVGSNNSTYLLHGTYRIAGKRLIFSISAEPSLKSYRKPKKYIDYGKPERDQEGKIIWDTEHIFDGWEGRTFVFTIIDGETFADDDGNRWIRLSD